MPYAAAPDGTRIYYETHGAGRPLYVCHGGPNATFSYLVPDLQPLERCRTLVYHEYRGSGRSGTAPPETYTFPHLADDLDALRAHLGHDRIDLLAHSLGGFPAQLYALRYPERTGRLVLISTTPTGNYRALARPAVRALGLRRLLALAARAAAYAARWAWRPESPARRSARYALFRSLQEGRPAFRAEVEAREAAAAIDPDNVRHLERCIYATDLRPALPGLRPPVLVLCGARDAVFAAAAALYRRSRPRAQVVLLPGVGHHPLIEAREESLALIGRFLGCGANPAP